MEATETEATQSETVEVEAVTAPLTVVEQEISDVDQVTTVWSQLDPSTREAILMLVEADRMIHGE